MVYLVSFPICDHDFLSDASNRHGKQCTENTETFDTGEDGKDDENGMDSDGSVKNTGFEYRT